MQDVRFGHEQSNRRGQAQRKGIKWVEGRGRGEGRAKEEWGECTRNSKYKCKGRVAG
jgi:hypothetical protein